MEKRKKKVRGIKMHLVLMIALGIILAFLALPFLGPIVAIVIVGGVIFMVIISIAQTVEFIKNIKKHLLYILIFTPFLGLGFLIYGLFTEESWMIKLGIALFVIPWPLLILYGRAVTIGLLTDGGTRDYYGNTEDCAWLAACEAVEKYLDCKSAAFDYTADAKEVSLSDGKKWTVTGWVGTTVDAPKMRFTAEIEFFESATLFKKPKYTVISTNIEQNK